MIKSERRFLNIIFRTIIHIPYIAFLGILLWVVILDMTRERKNPEDVIEYRIEQNPEKDLYAIFHLKRKYLSDPENTFSNPWPIPPYIGFGFYVYYPSFDPNNPPNTRNQLYYPKGEVGLRIEITSGVGESYTEDNLKLSACKPNGWSKDQHDIQFTYKRFRVNLDFISQAYCQKLTLPQHIKAINDTKKFIDDFYQGIDFGNRSVKQDNLVIIRSGEPVQEKPKVLVK